MTNSRASRTAIGGGNRPWTLEIFLDQQRSATGPLLTYMRNLRRFRYATKDADAFAKSIEKLRNEPNPYTSPGGKAIYEEMSIGAIFGLQWQMVMLVTFAEVYLEGVLVDRARHKPEIVLSRAKHLKRNGVSLHAVMRAQSLESLREPYYLAWAHGIVSKGPAAWAPRLAEYGLAPYDKDLIDDMQLLWDKRNVVVHGAGSIDTPFLQKYPMMGYEAGNILPCELRDVEQAVFATATFVRITDGYLRQSSE